jgi:hypothetical protein
MGLFNWFFKKKPSLRQRSSPPHGDDVDDLDGGDDFDDLDDDEEGFTPSDQRAIEGPPEFVRAAQMQLAYWKHDPAEQARLESRPVEQLAPAERLRLHHLYCLAKLGPETDRTSASEKCLRSLRALFVPESPFRPRTAFIWKSGGAPSQSERDPDLQGELLNPSLTHVGVLEVIRVDAENRPVKLDFVGFDELSGVIFAPPSVFRPAKLFYEDGRQEIVSLPLLYGLTWTRGNQYDRSGQMTRFVGHLEGDDVATLGAFGIGLGQQDLSIRAADGGATLFGVGSVGEISFPLDMRDPRFDEKARARGIDPDEVRRNWKE